MSWQLWIYSSSTLENTCLWFVINEPFTFPCKNIDVKCLLLTRKSQICAWFKCSEKVLLAVFMMKRFSWLNVNGIFVANVEGMLNNPKSTTLSKWYEPCALKTESGPEKIKFKRRRFGRHLRCCINASKLCSSNCSSNAISNISSCVFNLIISTMSVYILLSLYLAIVSSNENDFSDWMWYTIFGEMKSTDSILFRLNRKVCKFGKTAPSNFHKFDSWWHFHTYKFFKFVNGFSIDSNMLWRGHIYRITINVCNDFEQCLIT